MRIEAVHLRRFRGIKNSSLIDAAGINVLIGKNNAGKSSVLAAIELALGAIKSGRIASVWETKTRPQDDFTDKNHTKPFEIGVTFHLDKSILNSLRDKIVSSNPSLDIEVDKILSYSNASVILSGDIIKGDPYLCVNSLGLGDIDLSGDTLIINGKKLFQAARSATVDFAEKDQRVRQIRSDLSSIENVDRSTISYALSEGPTMRSRRLRDMGHRLRGSPTLRQSFESIIQESEKVEDFDRRVAELKTGLENDIEDIENSVNSSRFHVFSETTDKLPNYVTWFLTEIGSGTTQSFKEIRPAIGRDEASQLLKLKTKRGGAEALGRLQKTVKSLLGVAVDAFEPEYPDPHFRSSRSVEAEMDIDDFLVEANGAGIREALRIILDLELGSPTLALIEEPEVHLHPGLEKVLHNYLIEKSKNIQLFIATHSPNFIDSSTRQNVYRLTRPESGNTEIHKVASEEDLIDIVNEVGLKASTVLMYDRLVFVEGQSDEEIITELGRRLEIDLSLSNTAFVQMGGSSRIHHFVSDRTVEILSRRQIKCWFLIDRDEKADDDIAKIKDKLGDNATILVLPKRELENYLLNDSAIRGLIQIKSKTTNVHTALPSDSEIRAEIKSAATALLDESISLRLKHKMLKPVYPNYGGSTPAEKLRLMIEELEQRLNGLEETERTVRDALSKNWNEDCLRVAPGSMVIDKVLSKYGMKYRKESDAQRLAEIIDLECIDADLRKFLKSISSNSEV